MAGTPRSRRARARRRRRARVALALLLVAGAAGGGYAALRSGGHRLPRAGVGRVVGRAGRPGTADVRTAVLHLPAQLPGRYLSLPILMYHRIDVLNASLPAITRRLTVPPSEFAAEMSWLARHGFHAITQLQAFDALEHGARLPSKPLMITFDDGYRDVWGKASQILARLHMPATAYVITGRISGPDPSFLTWSDLHALERRGIAIGSHTVTHTELTLLSDSEALGELRKSRATLERRLGHPVQWFAYPAGAEDARVVRLTRSAGYVLAVTTHPGFRQSAAAPLELHRIEVLDSTGVSGLASLLRTDVSTRR